MIAGEDTMFFHVSSKFSSSETVSLPCSQEEVLSGITQKHALSPVGRSLLVGPVRTEVWELS